MEDGSGAGPAWPARPLPQGMMRVKADEFGRFYTHEAGEVFATRALQIQTEHGSREANRYLLRKLGTDLSFDFDEGYFAEALNYHLALLYAHLQLPERMAGCIAQSKTMPTSEDNKIFSDHVTLSVVTREHQHHAIARKIPAFLFACMPRSASRVHYVTGDDDAWRTEVGDKIRGEMWQACTPEIREMLALEP